MLCRSVLWRYTLGYDVLRFRFAGNAVLTTTFCRFFLVLRVDDVTRRLRFFVVGSQRGAGGLLRICSMLKTRELFLCMRRRQAQSCENVWSATWEPTLSVA